MYKLFTAVTITLLCLTSVVISLKDGTIIDGKTTDLPPINDLTTPVEPEPTIPTKPTDGPNTTHAPNSTTTSTTTVTPPTTSTKPNTTTVSPPTTTVPPTTSKPNTTTTVTPPTTTSPNKTTTATPVTTTAAPPHPERKFDGPSFIGGIVLASGLMAIGFVAWKFYKARTERNYHTL